MTQKNPRGFRAWYGDLKLQSKFTLALTLIVVVPAILVAVFFYHQLYDMVVSNEENAYARKSVSTASGAGSAVDTPSPKPVAEDSRKLIRTASLTIRTAQYDADLDAPFYKSILVVIIMF